MQIMSINTGNSVTDETLAAAVRNSQIGQGKGALIVRAGDDAEPRHLLEKIIVAVALPEDGAPVAAEDVPWKPESTVILVGGAEDFLEVFESLVPGFNDLFGDPVGVGG